MKKILVVGSLNMDVSVRMERLPAVTHRIQENNAAAAKQQT